MQNAVLQHKIERANKGTAKRRAATEAGADQRFDIYTNNWCLRLASVRESGLTFDEALRFTGGSDTRFSRQMRDSGKKIGWVPSAVVRETIPAKRLNLTYYMARARDQATNSVLTRKNKRGTAWLKAIPRTIDALIALAKLPVRGRVALVSAAFKIAMAAGFLRGSIGWKSRHYAPQHESAHSEERGPA